MAVRVRGGSQRFQGVSSATPRYVTPPVGPRGGAARSVARGTGLPSDESNTSLTAAYNAAIAAAVANTTRLTAAARVGVGRGQGQGQGK